MHPYFNEEYYLRVLRRLLATPSPVSYYVKMKPVLEELARELGYQVTYDRRETAYITVDGKDNDTTVMYTAHLDTLGMMVRSIAPDGTLRMRSLGGINYHNVEGRTVTVHTRDGREYTGLCACVTHSVHLTETARDIPRDDEHMMVLLDECVSSKEEVKALGIRPGDPISIEAGCEVTPNGFVKARYLDDKAGVACCFALLRYLKESGEKPAYRTIFSFPYAEEIYLGGTYVPEGVSQYIAVDITLIGPDHDGDEHMVSICAKDFITPYHYGLVTELMERAERMGLNYAVDVFNRYGTDANAALQAGHNLRAAAFGMPVYCTHGVERTHLDALRATTDLLAGCVLGL